MENRLFGLFLTKPERLLLGLLFVAGSACADQHGAVIVQDESFGQVVEQNVERRQIDESKIDTEDFEISFYAGLISIEDFGVGGVIGGKLAYHLSENLFFEGVYAISEAGKTSFERLGGNVQLLTDNQRQYEFYNISLGYNFLGETFVGEKRAFNTALYVIGGAGGTEFAGDNFFTVNLGIGYRFLLNDAIALHVDFRDHIFDIDLLGRDKTTNNLEFTLGISVFY